MLTLDLQILGQRHKDLRNGLSRAAEVHARSTSGRSPPARSGRWRCSGPSAGRFGNIVGRVGDVEDIASLAAWTNDQFDPRLSWSDVAWIRENWGGKLILKGILDPEDARMAADTGADALIVSNHGGRQLDGARSSISALPRIVEAVGDRIEVHLDGGIRSGQDVLKAVALGAKGTYIGRAFLYGLGAGGKAGVTRALEIIRNEMDVTHGALRQARHRRGRPGHPRPRSALRLVLGTDCAHDRGRARQTRSSNDVGLHR